LKAKPKVVSLLCAAGLDAVQSRLDFTERMLAQKDRGTLPDG